jgi:cold shock CspA family protein
MRIGIVVKVLVEKKIGFIRSADLREDVFFHFSKVEQIGTSQLAEGDEVEYEIEELQRIKKEKIQATRVRRAKRPLSAKLKSSDAPKLKAKHHPKALKRRPAWRKKDSSQQDGMDE